MMGHVQMVKARTTATTTETANATTTETTTETATGRDDAPTAGVEPLGGPAGWPVRVDDPAARVGRSILALPRSGAPATTDAVGRRIRREELHG